MKNLTSWRYSNILGKLITQPQCVQKTTIKLIFKHIMVNKHALQSHIHHNSGFNINVK